MAHQLGVGLVSFVFYFQKFVFRWAKVWVQIWDFKKVFIIDIWQSGALCAIMCKFQGTDKVWVHLGAF